MSLRILNAEPHEYSRKAYSILSELGTVTEQELSQQQLEEEIQGFDVLIVRLGLRVTREVINRGKSLKFILSATTGTDHIDLTAAAERNIQVICLKGEEEFLRSIPSTAEHTWALLLALVRQLPGAVQSVQQGQWNRDAFKGHNLSGKRLGIFGLGRVGKQVAHYARAFNCEVAAYDPDQSTWLEFVHRFPEARALAGWSDIICIHIPYSAKTHHFIGKELLPHFKKGSLVINTSRGGVWDEPFVGEYLQRGNLAGVATDVLEFELEAEKRATSPLLKAMKENYNVIITPHIAGATYESMEMTEMFIAEKLKKALHGLH
ncbi:MAG: hypothetical protein JNJ65_06065 [Cyclobacteriaceae bacterium]|nr:hypothetical protein [Cyclobacteriaceae bacterium]